MPSTVRLIPATIRKAPRQSTRAGRLTSLSLAKWNSTSAKTATGTLIQKIARQVQNSVRYEPATGPIAVNSPATMKKTASPLPRSAGGNASSTSTVAEGISSPAPMPCSTRKVTSQGTAMLPLSGTSPHSSELPAKRMTPVTTIRLCPRMSPSRPPSATNAAVESA